MVGQSGRDEGRELSRKADFRQGVGRLNAVAFMGRRVAYTTAGGSPAVRVISN